MGNIVSHAGRIHTPPELPTHGTRLMHVQPSPPEYCQMRRVILIAAVIFLTILFIIRNLTQRSNETCDCNSPSSFDEEARYIIQEKKMFQEGLPYFAVGPIVKGFGRGSKELGIPTANYPEEVVQNLPQEVGTGVYCGWASVNNGEVHKMVINIGWNPSYKNTNKSMETHILHDFPSDLYGSELKIVVLGFLRPEKKFNSVDDLIIEIRADIAAAKMLLDEPLFANFRTNSFFTGVDEKSDPKESRRRLCWSFWRCSFP